jgi:PAS domain S-box-containing protein
MSTLSEIISNTVVDSLPVGLLIVDQSGHCLTVNPATAVILGYPQAELLGRGLGELFFQDAANTQFSQVFVDVIQKELVGLCREVPYRTPEGVARRLSVISSYLGAGATDKAAVILILHDITELSRVKRHEAAVLEEINRVQEDKIRCLSKLAASVAHQIRNPATAIGGFAIRLDRLLKSRGIDSEYPGIILDEARRLEGLVRTVGRFAALSRLQLAPVTLSAVLAEARGIATEQATRLGRDMRWRLLAPEVNLVADPVLLATAFGELFRNAVEFATAPQVTVEITGDLGPDTLHLTVADDGPGIAPQDAPHIFDPFYSSRPDGSGMGLPLAQEILIEHNGRLGLDRDASGGARFHLSLPLFPSHLVSRLDEAPKA